MPAISTLRLTLLRASYLVLVVGLSTKYAPVVFGELASLPRMDGVVVALLSALGILSVAGVLSPLRLLPLLVFEIAWKLLWVSAVALPKWLDGSLDQGTIETLFACAWAVPFIFIVPWRHVARTYLSVAEPLRAADGAAKPARHSLKPTA